MSRLDPFTVELMSHRLSAITDEMSLRVVRTAMSVGIKSLMDFSTAICNRSGQVIVQGLNLPLHLGAVPDAMETFLREFGDSIQPDDVYLLNDPYSGGMHLPDIFVARPLFYRNAHAGFAVVVAHHTDVGGRVPGSSAADSSEIYAEGLRLPPLRLDNGGVRNDTLEKIIRANVRLPRILFADLQAQVTACRIAEERYRDFCAEFGAKGVERATAEIIDNAETRTRAAIAALPDGVYTAEDFVDDAGIGRNPVRLRVSITIDGDKILASFDGTDRQVDGAINATLSFTKSATYLAIKSITPPDIPCNQGFMDAISVTAPPGTVVNLVPPAACAARGVTGYRTADVVFRARAKVVPERVPAAGEGGNSGIRLAGYTSKGDPFFLMDAVVGSWGGRPGKDGVEGIAPLAINIANTPVEVLEAEHPMRVEAYGFVPDSGGAGEYRGGLALKRDIKLLEESATLSIRSDRRRFRPYGLSGGQEGSPSWNILNPTADGGEIIPTKYTGNMKKGDVIRHITAGGGGWGDPLRRDLDRVLENVLDEKLTETYVRKEYGVIIDSAKRTVDVEATKTLRETLKYERSAASTDRGEDHGSWEE